MKDQLLGLNLIYKQQMNLYSFMVINDITDTNLFTKQNLIELKAIENINKVMNKLNEYYTINQSILSSMMRKMYNILRQLLKIVITM